MRALMLIGVVGLIGVGCGKPSLQASCQRAASTQCKRFFECAKGAAESTYGTENNCITAYSNYCDLYKNYECDDLSSYDRCIDDYSRTTCSGTTPPSCEGSLTGASCRVTGRVTCSSTDSSSNTGTCSVTLSGCSDGHSYVLSCSGSSCSCNDGVSPHSVTSTCNGKSSAISTCGWNVQP